MTDSAKYGMKRRCTSKQAQLIEVYASRMNQIGRDTVQKIITDAFYANFLDHFTMEGEGKDIQNRLTWLQRLPVLTIDRSNHALILALEATATGYGAIMSSQSGLNKHARELYGTALHAHHDMLQMSGSKYDITIHAVSTSVLLSFFEAMQATTADAYRAHIYGAARLLEVTGPGECGHGVLCQLFYHVRTQMLFVQLASDHRPVPISAKSILYDTLSYKQPPLIQKLMCCIAGLLDLHAAMPSTDEQESAHALFELQIDQLWSEFSRQGMDSPGKDKAEHFSDAFSALTLAYFSSTKVILAMFRHGSRDLTSLKLHTQLILDAATYLGTGCNPIAFMRMATPLLLVALHGEGPEHRASAINQFKTWSTGNMRGISALALDSVYRQAGKDIQ
ncbi:hypothetical protein SVAN01_01592 [Stagonosporopsis vannaccii]|nr:hypothetical protein SVAN01_01592 [Stagonosporopsis vannaccii]